MSLRGPVFGGGLRGHLRGRSHHKVQTLGTPEGRTGKPVDGQGRFRDHREGLGDKGSGAVVNCLLGLGGLLVLEGASWRPCAASQRLSPGHGRGCRLAPALPSLPERALFLPRLGLDGMKMQVRHGAVRHGCVVFSCSARAPAVWGGLTVPSRRPQQESPGPGLRWRGRDPEPSGAASGAEPCPPGRAASRPPHAGGGVRCGWPTALGCYR